ncbi:MAG: ATP-binding protein, partial [Phycisphaerae bacterium]|nr:ATP-binding protein [Phycisphaerae bacterium]
QRIEELARVIMAYSELTERLQVSHEQLKAQVARLRKELSEKNRQLERRNRLAALGEMAAGLAHEIRNPLGAIQLYAGMLREDLQDRPESQQLVEKITRGVRRLEELVSQVLQFTREMRAVPRRCDLAQVIADTLELAEARASKTGVMLRAEGPLQLPVEVDACLLGQALLNLLLNAIEAQPGGGEVLVRYAGATDDRAARQFSLEVIDRGPGIAADALDRIFNPFFTTKESGTGLGLAIVHRIVEAHDGTVSASNIDGGGARFEIRI